MSPAVSPSLNISPLVRNVHLRLASPENRAAPRLVRVDVGEREGERRRRREGDESARGCSDRRTGCQWRLSPGGYPLTPAGRLVTSQRRRQACQTHPSGRPGRLRCQEVPELCQDGVCYVFLLKGLKILQFVEQRDEDEK